jgi:hypothetical protein
MNKRKAILILEDQKNKIHNSGFQPIPWIDETLNYIILIFGKESEQYRQISNLHFEDSYPKMESLLGKIIFNGIEIKDEQDIAEDYINSFIDQIKNTGLPNINNFPKDKIYIDKMIFWTILPIIIGGCFSFGLYIGQSRFDKEKQEYYLNQKEWKDKYDSLKREYNLLLQKRESIKKQEGSTTF